MAEFEDKLNSILGNQEAMSQIMALARSLSGEQPPAPEQAGLAEGENYTPVAASPPPPDLSAMLGQLDPKPIQVGMDVIRQVQKEEPAKKEQFDRMRQIISYMHTHYQEDISLEQLAKVFYISPYYLCREFKRHMDCTMVQYLNVTRIMNAQRKLMETDLNITQVSRETGFSNLTHFNRVFKSIAGMTPSEYQKKHKSMAQSG